MYFKGYSFTFSLQTLDRFYKTPGPAACELNHSGHRPLAPGLNPLLDEPAARRPAAKAKREAEKARLTGPCERAGSGTAPRAPRPPLPLRPPGGAAGTRAPRPARSTARRLRRRRFRPAASAG